MAIVNATPDSFYAASRTQLPTSIAERVEQAIKEGAVIIDIGGYSSRPDAEDVSVDEEWRRVEVALSATRAVSSEVAISVDTFRSEVVRRAYENFGDIVVNDITAGKGDAEMLQTVVERKLPYIAMHMRGTPQTMQRQTQYNDVVAEVVAELQERLLAIDEAGIERSRVALDPGFGFAKTVEQNYELLAGLHRLKSLEQPLLVGVSRKSMIYKPLGITPDEALAATQAVHWEALRQGATLLRVHDVAEAVQTIKLYEKFSNNDKGF
ncbi:MAG: dihydropteroate synthase [Alistipes sp.]|nr:dihydropteroate synthase [Alistipes sp.]